MLYLKSNEPEKFNQLRLEKSDSIIPDEMKENSIEIYECSMSMDESGGDLAKPMIPNPQQERLNERIPDWALNINYRSKTQKKSRKTMIRSVERIETQQSHKKFAKQEEELLKAEQERERLGDIGFGGTTGTGTHPTRESSQQRGHAFDHIGDEDADLSEIRLDMKEGGQREQSSIKRLKNQLISA